MTVPAPAVRLITLERVGSTNDEVLDRARAGAAELTLVVAAEQTGGRGRRGRTWHSPRGNLYASLLLRPVCPAQRLSEIGFIGAVAAAEACNLLLGGRGRVELKWPNDLLRDGAKVAGVLVEAEGDTDDRRVALGIGINIASAPAGLPYPATVLDGLAVVDLRDALAERLAFWYRRWRDEGFAPVRAAWVANAAPPGRSIAVRIEGEVVQGRFGGIDETGALILDLPAGRRRVLAGDVLFAAA